MAYPEMPERCDYGLLKSEFDSIFQPNRKCIIRVDLDGLLSAVLMGHLLKWEIVGTYDASSLHVVRGCLPTGNKGIEKALAQGGLVFLDHDIYRKDIDSIGHHLLMWSENIPVPLHTEGRHSLNPNLLRRIAYNKAFNRKYPFSTFHFRLACASAWGTLGDFHPDEEITTLLLHIDSSFVNAINYQSNALDRLDWLGGSEEKSPLYPICRRMLRFTPRTIIEQFRYLEERLAGFRMPPQPSAALVRPGDAEAARAVRDFLRWLEQETGWRANLVIRGDSDIATYTLKRRSAKPLRSEFEPAIASEPFSYAILNRGEGGLNYGWLEEP